MKLSIGTCLLLALTSLVFAVDHKERSNRRIKGGRNNRRLKKGRQARRAQGPALNFVGNDNFPLGLCEGDCDFDFDCAGDLVCFYRYDGGGSKGKGKGKGSSKGFPEDFVPGCSGTPERYVDYCINNNANLAPFPLEYIAKDPLPGELAECDGDCDFDTDCPGALICWQRDNDEPLPDFADCVGTPVDRVDYCI